MRITFIISLMVAAVAVIFALQNAQPARVNFFRWSFEASLVIVLLLTFLAGIASAIIASIPGRIKFMRELSALRRAAKETVKTGEGGKG